METIASLAAVAQLIDQSISLIQHIIEAYDAIREARKTLQAIGTQLYNHRFTLEEIESVPDLNTSKIRHQLDQIYQVIKELETFAGKLEARRRKGKLHHSVHTIFNKSRDDGRLADILSRLSEAEAQLSMLMQTAHIRMTSSMSMGIQRIEEAQMNYRERYTTSLDISQSSRGDVPMGTWRGKEEREIYDSEKHQYEGRKEETYDSQDIDEREDVSGYYEAGPGGREAYIEKRVKQLPAEGNSGSQKSQRSRGGYRRGVAMEDRRQVEQAQEDAHRENYHHQYVVERNMASQGSKQVNGVMGLESARWSTMASVRDNQSSGNGQQQNLILTGPAALQFFESMNG